MSDISARIVTDPNEGIHLNAYIFSTTVMAYMLNDVTAVTARNFINNHILANGGTVLTSEEEADIAAMKTFYDGLTAVAKSEYRDKLIAYAQIVQEGQMSETAWDGFMGL